MVNHFRVLKFRTGKFSYNSICTKIFQDVVLSLHFLYVLLERSRPRWRVRKTVVFAVTTYAKDMAGSYRRVVGV